MSRVRRERGRRMTSDSGGKKGITVHSAREERKHPQKRRANDKGRWGFDKVRTEKEQVCGRDRDGGGGGGKAEDKKIEEGDACLQQRYWDDGSGGGGGGGGEVDRLHQSSPLDRSHSIGNDYVKGRESGGNLLVFNESEDVGHTRQGEYLSAITNDLSNG
ncbi:hypothetical protein BKA80DRAFT_253510 [Phyllosticta citrichinensis]